MIATLKRNSPFKSTSVRDTPNIYEPSTISHKLHKSSRLEHPSIPHDGAPNGIESNRTKEIQTAIETLLGFDNDRQTLKEETNVNEEQMSKSNIVDSLVVAEEEQKGDRAQSNLKDFVNGLPEVESVGKDHGVHTVLEPNSFKDKQKDQLVGLLKKIVDKQAVSNTNFSSNRINELYVPTSMPLGPALQLEHNPSQAAVVRAIKHAWKGYKDFAWGKDELLPISKSGSSSPFGLGMTIVDCLDVLWLVGLQDEFDEARDWVKDSMNIVTNTKTVSLFETNIRVLGGLLSAYHLSQEQIFLDRAVSWRVCCM